MNSYCFSLRIVRDCVCPSTGGILGDVPGLYFLTARPPGTHMLDCVFLAVVFTALQDFLDRMPSASALSNESQCPTRCEDEVNTAA